MNKSLVLPWLIPPPSIVGCTKYFTKLRTRGEKDKSGICRSPIRSPFFLDSLGKMQHVVLLQKCFLFLCSSNVVEAEVASPHQQNRNG